MAGVGTEITEYLKEFHAEEKNAIKGRDLCVLFNLTDKQIRNVVTVLRQNGEAICSSSYGYWYSTDPEDLEKTLHRMEAQVSNMNYSIEGLKKTLRGVYDEKESESNAGTK